jgi:hypothetical protein
VRIVHVEERSPAGRADWRPGVLMVTVVGEPVVDAQTLKVELVVTLPDQCEESGEEAHPGESPAHETG